MRDLTVYRKFCITVLITGFVYMAPASAENIFKSFTRSVKAQFSGANEVANLGGGKYEITYHGSASSNSAEKHKKWSALAKKTCNGRSYTVLDKRYRTVVTVDQIVIGTIRCSGSGGSGNKTITKSSVNKGVMKAQKQLINLGYAVTADGIMGNQTRKAIRSYQSKNSIDVTGELNSETLNQLNQTIDKPDSTITNSNVTKDTSTLQNTSDQTIDIVDEIRELHKLKEEGMISEEEYLLLKNKLLQ